MSEFDDRRPSEMVPFQTVQIIAIALIFGVLIFAVIAFVINQGKQPQMNEVAYVALAIGAGGLIGSYALPSTIVKEKMKELRATGSDISVMDLFAAYQTRIIVRSALLEGAAFLCLVFYIITALPWLLGTALFLIAVMAIGFPTRGRFDNWVREVRELQSLEQM